MSRIVFRHHHKAGCILVQSVDNAGAQDAIYSRKIRAVEQKRVYQSMGVVARRRMNHHPRFLVDHQKIGVFIDYLQRYVFRLQGKLLQGRYLYVNLLSPPYPV